MKIFYHLLPAILLTATLSLTAACGEGGTETGNPQIQDEGDQTGGDDTGGDEPEEEDLPIGNMALPTATQILEQICTKLTGCFASLDSTSCEEGVLEVDNIDDDLGLVESFESYQAIIDAETTGTITPNGEPATVCLEEISALACSGQAVQSSYSAANPANFNNVHSMIPDGEDSCGGVY